MTIEQLTPTDFIDRRDSGELWQLLDVRETWEVNLASVVGALCIPMGEVIDRVAEIDSSAGVAVMCHSGGRSARVAEFLVQNGFKRVANIAGGIDTWAQDVDQSIPRY